MNWFLELKSWKSGKAWSRGSSDVLRTQFCVSAFQFCTIFAPFHTQALPSWVLLTLGSHPHNMKSDAGDSSHSSCRNLRIHSERISRTPVFPRSESSPGRWNYADWLALDPSVPGPLTVASETHSTVWPALLDRVLSGSHSLRVGLADPWYQDASPKEGVRILGGLKSLRSPL